MRRREFVVGGLTAAAWPIAARAQGSPRPVIGFLASGSADGAKTSVAAFREGLGETGYVEGRNVAIEYRWADGHYDRLGALAADLVHLQAAVIATSGSGSGLAAKAATTTIPIVFTSSTDPIKEGVVTSINRPGGNATGVNMLLNALEGKRFTLLHEVIPTAALIAAILNPANQAFDTQLNDVQEAAREVGQQIKILPAGSESEIDAAFVAAVKLQAGGLLVGADAFFVSQREQLAALTVRHAMPAIFHAREIAEAGGLMSYGTNFSEGYRQVGIYTGRILKGEKPGDLPVFSSVKFDFVINLKTARALGLTIPSGVLAIADEVIE
jgi:putative tryptophan/tyrosine transport system substrate-binding protein